MRDFNPTLTAEEKKTLARKLRQLRQAKKWSLRWVAEQLGVATQTVGNWELNKAWPESQQMLTRWCEVLDYHNPTDPAQSTDTIRHLVNEVKQHPRTKFLTIPNPFVEFSNLNLQ